MQATPPKTPHRAPIELQESNFLRAFSDIPNINNQYSIFQNWIVAQQRKKKKVK